MIENYETVEGARRDNLFNSFFSLSQRFNFSLHEII